MKLGTVDMTRILDGSKRGKALSERLKAIHDKHQAQIGPLETKLQQVSKSLNNAPPTGNMEVSFKLQRDSRLLDMELRFVRERGRAEIEMTRDHFRQLLIKEVEPMLEALADEKGCTVVLTVPGSGVLYAQPDLDLTDDLLQRLDQFSK